MTVSDAASSKVHLHSSFQFSPGPVASFGSKLPWTLPLAFHPTVTSDAERDRRQPWTLGWEPCAPLNTSDLVSHQSSFTPIARVLRHLTLQHFRVIIAFAACCCSLGLSAPGQPVTQEHPSKFLLVAPGISSCVTWRTLAACRRSRICPRETSEYV
jgi:hypothetical protein